MRYRDSLDTAYGVYSHQPKYPPQEMAFPSGVIDDAMMETLRYFDKFSASSPAPAETVLRFLAHTLTQMAYKENNIKSREPIFAIDGDYRGASKKYQYYNDNYAFNLDRPDCPSNPKKPLVVEVTFMDDEIDGCYLVFTDKGTCDYSSFAAVEKLFTDSGWIARWVGDVKRKPNSKTMKWEEDIDDEG